MLHYVWLLILPDIVEDCPKMRSLPKIFLRTFENVGPGQRRIQ